MGILVQSINSLDARGARITKHNQQRRLRSLQKETSERPGMWTVMLHTCSHFIIAIAVFSFYNSHLCIILEDSNAFQD